MLEEKITKKEFVKLLAGLISVSLLGSKLGLFDKIFGKRKDKESSSYGNGVYGG